MLARPKMHFAVLAVLAGVAIMIACALPDTYELQPSTPHTSATMDCVRYDRHGNSSVLTHSTVCPRPTTAPHQLLIRVRYAAINPCDFKFRRSAGVPTFITNFILPKPKIPGADVAGVIVEVGSAVDRSRFSPGDHVAAMMPLLGTPWGSYAQFVTVSAAHAAKVPAGVALRDAAAVPLVSLTVLQAFAHLRNSEPEARTMQANAQSGFEHLRGKKLLVQAGGGGVGSFALQWGTKVLGMVAATTGRMENAPRLRALGASTVVDYTDGPFEAVQELHDSDVVLDPMSFAYEARTLAHDSRVLRRGNPDQGQGHYLNIIGSDWALDASGSEVGNGPTTWLNLACAKTRGFHCTAQRALNRVLRLLGLHIHAGSPWSCRGYKYDVTAVSPDGAMLANVMEKLGTGEIKAVIDRIFSLERASEAHAYLERGHARGKVLLSVTQKSKSGHSSLHNSS